MNKKTHFPSKVNVLRTIKNIPSINPVFLVYFCNQT
jgi:hypothetical protein